MKEEILKVTRLDVKEILDSVKKGGRNIIDGEECCWRCGMDRKEVKRTQHACNTWGKIYAHHLWNLPPLKGN